MSSQSSAHCVVSDNKDTNFWKQFTTLAVVSPSIFELFQTTKIQIFESNSQQDNVKHRSGTGCFRQQRYKFLKAIHNLVCSRIQSITVVSDNKDTNFWKQFTTWSKNDTELLSLFQTTKIQIFESNSQRIIWKNIRLKRCFRQQRYKFLKAIHNLMYSLTSWYWVVSDNKDTNFWKQFTTVPTFKNKFLLLFQTTKIQIFESNSQRLVIFYFFCPCCFRQQRYKFLKAIHN